MRVFGTRRLQAEGLGCIVEGCTQSSEGAKAAGEYRGRAAGPGHQGGLPGGGDLSWGEAPAGFEGQRAKDLEAEPTVCLQAGVSVGILGRGRRRVVGWAAFPEKVREDLGPEPQLGVWAPLEMG